MAFAETSDRVIYVDPYSIPHDALVTGGHMELSNGWRNLVFVSTDKNKTDTYGRQIERQTSCSHISNTTAPGNYWCYPPEYNAERDVKLRKEQGMN